MKKKLSQTVFLDRDGVINVDSPDYIKTWEEFTFIDGSLEAIRRLTESNFHIILITNQSIINRKMVPKKELDYIFSMMTKKIQDSGGKITDIFYCPHTPDDQCACRKPLPGLIHQALELYEIDMKKAFMVGDSAKDIECARNAGCGNLILVQTGNGPEAKETLSLKNIFPDYVAENLLDATKWIIGSRKPT
jgi:D-glycero-D-manno-heptose 1,7-bisphosphate phosphatase